MKRKVYVKSWVVAYGPAEGDCWMERFFSYQKALEFAMECDAKEYRYVECGMLPVLLEDLWHYSPNYR